MSPNSIIHMARTLGTHIQRPPEGRSDAWNEAFEIMERELRDALRMAGIPFEHVTISLASLQKVICLMQARKDRAAA